MSVHLPSLLRPPAIPAIAGRWRVPTQCAVCHGWGRERLCAACVSRFLQTVARCRRCAIRLAGAADVCGACLRQPPAFDQTTAAADYDFPFDGLITRFKFHGGLDLARALADALANSLASSLAQTHADANVASVHLPPDLLLPIPLSAARLRERGYNQAWEITRRVGPRFGIDVDSRLLLRIKETPHQTGLPLHRRAANIRGAFAVDPLRAEEIRGRSIALVDDVMTTGATANEAAQVLKQAGASRVALWVVARTPAPEG